MPLMSLSGARISFSDAPLLDAAELFIEAKERVCLVGRNGAGKSTLLKILGKELVLDDGRLVYEQGLVVSRLQQDPPRDISGRLFDFVAQGVSTQATQLKEYYGLLKKMESDPSDAQLKQLSLLQEQLDHQGIWLIEDQIHNLLEKLGLEGEQLLESLSGGWLRKAALARALVCEPDVLLLDEPTNHLDIETMTWLESLLKAFSGSIVFISHDRSFIRNIASRIVDLDRGKLVSWPGDYEAYLNGKEEALRVESLQNTEFDRRLAQEEIWIRQGIKARRTRNEGRVRALKAMRMQHAQRRSVQGSANMQLGASVRSGKIIFDLEALSYQVADKFLVDNFTTQVQRGDKIALVGPNGCGKTTLIKLMLGELTPKSGKVHSGTKLDIAYFDQHRIALDPDKSVMDNLADGRQEVMINGRLRHVLGYLQDFLFHPKQAMTPVRTLSGGERNRLLLAKLFLTPSNLLILDEPTNDLDIETLELLEERISCYQGTVLLVSHDRQFVENSVTDCWFFEGNGVIRSYVGGYFDAYQQQQQSQVFRPQLKMPLPPEKLSSKNQLKRTQSKLSYHLVYELEQLPQRIEDLEQVICALQQQLSDPQFFNQSHDETQPVLQRLAETEQALEQAFLRWEALEAQKNS